jgi:hypothetical protein
MNKEHYLLEANTSRMEFEFVSEGPNGKIRKAVIYTLVNDSGFTFYNLGFGDLNETTGELDDLSKSNNGDRNKVLATVARTVLEFTSHFPKAIVIAKGSTSSRTRLYQMGLASNLEDIGKMLYVLGFINGNWCQFERNVNYEAFMVYRK